MHFASDNSGPALPEVLAAMSEANTGYAMAYGTDPIMDQVREKIREIFEAPDAAVYLVGLGTAANALSLATLCQPWETIFCTPMAHINVDECNAPEFYTGGTKLTPVGQADKMTTADLRSAIEAEENRGVHGPQRGPISITQVTECGTVYTLDELKALTDLAKSYNLPCHLDGARFANAMMTLGCSPAEMSWKAGFDAVSFGGTKNGCVGVEAVIFFDPKHAWEFELRRKRGAQLYSKHRFLSAQMLGYLTDDLWKVAAAKANTQAKRLSDGLRAIEGVTFRFEPQANMIFMETSRVRHQRLKAAGAIYHIETGSLEGDDPHETLMGRLVCDWSIPDAEIDRFIEIASNA